MNKDIINIFIGDSITYGVGDTDSFGWVNRLRYLNPKEYYFNLGIPGQNSNDIALRFNNEISTRYNKEDTFRIIYAFGIKDAILLNENKNQESIFLKNIKEIITTTKTFTSNIYFLGLLPVDTTIRKNYKESNITLIDNLIKDTCQKEKINYLSMKNIITKQDLSDGLHPNSIGHQKISDYIYKEIFINDVI